MRFSFWSLGALSSVVCTNPIVELKYATVEGIYEPNLDLQHFRGIRYAHAPVGELRWRKPIPIEALITDEMSFDDPFLFDEITSKEPYAPPGMSEVGEMKHDKLRYHRPAQTLQPKTVFHPRSAVAGDELGRLGGSRSDHNLLIPKKKRLLVHYLKKKKVPVVGNFEKRVLSSEYLNQFSTIANDQNRDGEDKWSDLVYFTPDQFPNVNQIIPDGGQHSHYDSKTILYPQNELKITTQGQLHRIFKPKKIHINATSFGPKCLQLPSRNGPKVTLQSSFDIHSPSDKESEDCLTLSITRPGTLDQSALPVVVLFQGGDHGATGEDKFTGESLVAHSNEGIIFVSVQYRLGIYGFLGGNAVANDGTLNVGIHDQVAALRWIKDNISQFGGDPSKVTIAGLASGAAHATYHLMRRKGEGDPMFRAAIIDSPIWPPMVSEERQESQYKALLESTRCHTLTCLRGIPSATLFAGSRSMKIVCNKNDLDADCGPFSFGPAVDDELIPDFPSKVFDRGQFYDLPLLIGYGEHQEYVFRNILDTHKGWNRDVKAVFPTTDSFFSTSLYNHYPNSQHVDASAQRQSWITDATIRCPTYFIASKAVQYDQNPLQIYKMVFEGKDTKGKSYKHSRIWAADPDFSTARNATLAKHITNYVLSFIMTTDPNEVAFINSPVWPHYLGFPQTTGGRILAVTDENILEQEDSDNAEHCDFFWRNGETIGY